MSLDYPYTCPDLDELIDQACDVIDEHVFSIVVEQNPWLGDDESLMPKHFLDSVKEVQDCLKDEIKDIFEDSRSINENIREAADNQINELKERVEDLEYELKESQEYDKD